METIPQENNKFDTVLAELHSAAIEPGEFLDVILSSDQEDSERGSSIDAVKILEKPEVVERFLGTVDEVKFFSVRSLSYFHKAQIRLSEGDMDVKDDLERAAQDSKSVGEQDADWYFYIKATIAYLDNDLAALRGFGEQVETNKALVENFIIGLEQRGEPHYLEDYAKPRG